jgi:hypothetical protein
VSDEGQHGCGVKQSPGGLADRFRDFPEPPISVDPGEEALNDPPLWMNGKADLILRLTDDFDFRSFSQRPTKIWPGGISSRPAVKKLTPATAFIISTENDIFIVTRRLKRVSVSNI